MTARDAKPDRHSLRLLSCNILAGARVDRYHQYFTRSWASLLPSRDKQGNLDRLARDMGEFDLIGLQEADAGSLRSGFRNQTEYLANAAGMPYWSYQPNRPIGHLTHTANGLISRMQPAEVLDYPLPGRIPGRGVLLASFTWPDTQLALAIAHLSLGTQARARQLEFIAELLAPYPHAILMGDLNTEIGSPELAHLFRETPLQPPSKPVLTFPSWQPQRAIDHILVSEEITMERMWALSDVFSDHLPLAAEVRLPEVAPAAPDGIRQSPT